MLLYYEDKKYRFPFKKLTWWYLSCHCTCRKIVYTVSISTIYVRKFFLINSISCVISNWSSPMHIYKIYLLEIKVRYFVKSWRIQDFGNLYKELNERSVLNNIKYL